MEKVNVEICNGMECSAREVEELPIVLRRLPESTRTRFELYRRNCFARCQIDPDLCPAVRINGEWLEPATPDSVLSAVEAAVSELPPIDESDDPFAKYFHD
jgi:NADH:ubiquinone oxidoreductase subunit E